MSDINDIEPKNVFKYFKEICEIPHGSSNTKEISDYLVDFAIKHGYVYKQDENNNVIIEKEASSGREIDTGVIIQGHMDMVNEKTADSNHNFQKDPLNLVIEGDYIKAIDTTLGGDDGIALAYALAILDDEKISHPRIEAVFTVDEEIGMLGAKAIDLSGIKGKYLLNIDSEEEGKLLVGCSGGLTSICKIPVQYNEDNDSENNISLRITINGLKGGHSGVEIIKERANADILLGRMLYEIVESLDGVMINDITGGTKDNAIPRMSEAVITINKSCLDDLQRYLIKINEVFKEEFCVTDPEILISSEKTDYHQSYLTIGSATKVIFFLMQTPCGIINMDKSIEGLVETSLNLGILKISDDYMIATYSVRSSVKSRKNAISNKLSFLTEFLGGIYETTGDYPEWSFKRDSMLRETMTEVYENMYGRKPILETIHAGVECGYFHEKIENLDAVSFGPDIFDIHTTEEKMSISSVKRVYEYIIEVLKNLR